MKLLMVLRCIIFLASTCLERYTATDYTEFTFSSPNNEVEGKKDESLDLTWKFTLSSNDSKKFDAVRWEVDKGGPNNIVLLVVLDDGSVINNANLNIEAPAFYGHVHLGNWKQSEKTVTFKLSGFNKNHTVEKLVCGLMIGGVVSTWSDPVSLKLKDVVPTKQPTIGPSRKDAAIIGGAVAASVVVIIAVSIGIYFWKKKSSTHMSRQDATDANQATQMSDHQATGAN